MSSLIIELKCYRNRNNKQVLLQVATKIDMLNVLAKSIQLHVPTRTLSQGFIYTLTMCLTMMSTLSIHVLICMSQHVHQIIMMLLQIHMVNHMALVKLLLTLYCSPSKFVVMF